MQKQSSNQATVLSQNSFAALSGAKQSSKKKKTTKDKDDKAKKDKDKSVHTTNGYSAPTGSTSAHDAADRGFGGGGTLDWADDSDDDFDVPMAQWVQVCDSPWHAFRLLYSRCASLVLAEAGSALDRWAAQPAACTASTVSSARVIAYCCADPPPGAAQPDTVSAPSTCRTPRSSTSWQSTSAAPTHPTMPRSSSFVHMSCRKISSPS
jgi:hypothetical protein